MRVCEMCVSRNEKGTRMALFQSHSQPRSKTKFISVLQKMLIFEFTWGGYKQKYYKASGKNKRPTMLSAYATSCLYSWVRNDLNYHNSQDGFPLARHSEVGICPPVTIHMIFWWPLPRRIYVPAFYLFNGHFHIFGKFQLRRST